jgi:hypothetical protein
MPIKYDDDVNVGIEPPEVGPDGDGEAEQVEQGEEGVRHLDLPTTSAVFGKMADEWEMLANRIDTHFSAVRGGLSLHTHVCDVTRWLRMCEDRAEKALVNLRTMKGEKQPAREVAYAKMSLRRVAEAYFDKLGESALRVQCRLFQVGYDGGDRKETIARLVEKQIEMSDGDGGDGLTSALPYEVS